MKGVWTERLTKTYGMRVAVDALDLEVATGEVFGLIGPNGAGKTTTVRMLITLLAPTSGEAQVFGRDVRREPERVREIMGYVPQERALDRYLTGREHLSLIGNLHHLAPEETRRRSRELFDLVGLTEQADLVVRNYSGGMKKKLEIACGLIHRPRVLFLDEPTLGLDIESRSRVWEHIRGLRAQGLTILITTNYLDEADLLCDRIAIFDCGRIRALGSPEELKKGLGGDAIWIRLTREALALSQAASLPGEIRALAGVREAVLRDATLEVRVTDHEVVLPSVVQRIASLGVPVETVQSSRPTLEQVFLKYAGRAISAGGQNQNVET